METRMVGDVVVVVIDEIGEVTFLHDPMQPHIVEIGRKETATRAAAALVEMLDVIIQVIPASAAGYELTKGLNLLLRDFNHLRDRLEEQIEFKESVLRG